jgi:hypothetical protein
MVIKRDFRTLAPILFTLIDQDCRLLI